MTQRLALAAVMALAMLAACSKPAPAPSADDDQEETAAVATPQPEAPRPSMGPADYPAQLLPLIDTAPQCEQFRAQLEAAGKTTSTDPLPVDMNEVNRIVAAAHEAGCTRKKTP